MKLYKQSLEMFRYNISAIVFFEIIYKIIATAFLAPVIYSILNFSVYAAGIRYLTVGTMRRFFSAPSTYALLFCILILLGIYLLINVSGIIYAIEASHKGEKTNALTILVKSVANSIRVIRPRNVGVMLYVLFILPFTYTIVISGTLIGIKLPAFFSVFLERHKMTLTICLIVYFILCVFSMLRIFCLNYFTLYRASYKQSVELSKKTIKTNVIKVFVGVLLYNTAITLVLYILEGVLAAIFAGIIPKLVASQNVIFVFDFIIRTIFVVLYLVFSVISTPLVYSYICACFYDMEDDIDYSEYEEVEKVRNKRRKKKIRTQKQIERNNKFAICFTLVAGLLLNGLYIYLSITDKINLNIAYSTRASVTAHRGDSENAPENTMAAFNLAVENMADIIEIDVRQTRDGKYIIMHDESLYRTTGVDKKVGEVDYAFIQTLDAGSEFSSEYAGEPIPTLEEVLEFAKENDVYLNIELKPAKTDVNYEQGIIDLIKQYEYEKDCMLASSNYKVLKNIKTIDPNIKTVYIMTMAYGEFGDMAYVDAFSIKHYFIAENMVKSIHKNGKDIYAWTVNKESDIKELLLLDVDGIITDNPYNTKEIVYNANDTLLTDWLQRLVEDY